MQIIFFESVCTIVFENSSTSSFIKIGEDEDRIMMFAESEELGRPRPPRRPLQIGAFGRFCSGVAGSLANRASAHFPCSLAGN